MRRVALAMGLLAALAAGGASSIAQPQSPLDAASASPADRPIAAVVHSKDAELDRLMTLLNGSHAAPAADQLDRPALWFHACPVSVSGWPEGGGALYFEIARDDNAAEPFQQGVMRFMRVRGMPRLRLFAFEGDLSSALVGLWAHPDSMPSLNAEALSVVADLPLRTEGDGFVGGTACPYPVTRDNAVEATTSIWIKPDSVRFEDQGLDADGNRVWGLTGEQAPTFSRSPVGAPLPISAQVRDSGLVVLVLKQPEAGSDAHEPGGQAAVHYSGWTLDGKRFDTSRQPGRVPYFNRFPGNVIKGWNQGLEGIARGERRRLVIPAELAFGPRGQPGIIPPNSPLIFEVECLYVDNRPPDAQPPAGLGADQRGSHAETTPSQTPPPRPPPRPDAAEPTRESPD